MSSSETSSEASNYTSVKQFFKISNPFAEHALDVEYLIAKRKKADDVTKAVQLLGTKFTKETALDFSKPSGWQRIKTIYTDNEVHAETNIPMKMSNTAFFIGSLVGVFYNYERAAYRYDIYSEGRIFLSPRDKILRKWDYALLNALRNGFRMGIKSAIFVGSMTFLLGHIAAWRDYFSAWYFPAISIPLIPMLALPYGSFAALEALGIGVTTGLSLSGTSYLLAYLNEKSVDETYKDLKSRYENYTRRRKLRDEALTEFMKQNHIAFRGDAWKSIRQKRLSDFMGVVDEKLVDLPSPPIGNDSSRTKDVISQGN